MRGDKPKTVDLSTKFVSFDATDEEWGIVAFLESRSTPEGALRPGVLLGAAMREIDDENLSSSTVRVRRVKQWHEDVDGRLVEPL
jgi:hypothetical protein